MAFGLGGGEGWISGGGTTKHGSGPESQFQGPETGDISCSYTVTMGIFTQKIVFLPVTLCFWINQTP